MKHHKTTLSRSKEDWQKAQQRVLLYLRLIRVSPPESLELALEAMKRAQSMGSPEHPPLIKSMQALCDLLRERETRRQKEGKGLDDFKPALVPVPSPLVGLFCKGLRSQPPLNRGSMLTERVV
jgi:hypothetical protein